MLKRSTESTLVLALDLETTIRAGRNRSALTPSEPISSIRGQSLGENRPPSDVLYGPNRIVVGAARVMGRPNDFEFSDSVFFYDDLDQLLDLLSEVYKHSNYSRILLVGVNVAFDYAYLLKSIKNFIMTPRRSVVCKILVNNTMLWDLSLVEYMVSGQSKKFPSMKQMAKTYGLHTAKGDLAEKYWDKGIDTTDIPEDELRDYLEKDMDLTCGIYEAQLKVLPDVLKRAPIFGKLLYDHMVGRTNTIRMSLNMFSLEEHSFKAFLNETKDCLEIAYTNLEKRLTDYLSMISAPAEVMQLARDNPASETMIKFICYGIAISYVTKVPYIKDGTAVRYKSGPNKGKIKLRNETKTWAGGENEKLAIAGIYHQASVSPNDWQTPKGNLKIDATTIQKCVDNPGLLHHSKDTTSILDRYLKYTQALKEDSTYGSGILKNLPGQMFTDLDSNGNAVNSYRVATEFNHTATGTGRLSSSRINVQNLKGG